MSNEKQQQIVEMAKDICRVKLNCNDVCNPVSACDALRYAERAVEAGYIKQNEGEWYVNYMINQTPSKRGRTIHYETYTCSVCGKPNGRHRPRFCPNCGAKMKGADNERVDKR